MSRVERIAPAPSVTWRRILNPARRGYYFVLRKLSERRRRPFLRIIEAEYERAIVHSLQCISSTTAGDIGEFGSRGVTAAVECRYLSAFGQDRAIHIFDAFERPLEPGAADIAMPEFMNGKWDNYIRSPNPVTAAELSRKLGKLYRQERIKIYEGLFRDTLSTIPASTRFAMVVMDATLPSSTEQVLSYLFSSGLVVEGAVILFSDWNIGRAADHLGSRRAWRQAVERFGIEYSDEGRYSWGGQRFIVQSYAFDNRTQSRD
jgi:hypothetical protein